MRDSVLSFFIPVEGIVNSVGNGSISAKMDGAPVLKEGMRFKVLRKGVPFLHPVTKEPLASLEENIGIAELVNADPSHLTLKSLDGNPAQGDIVRISRAKARLLFYQLGSVSWGISDEYFRLLKESNRFELLTTGLDNPEMAVEEAKRLKADAVLILSQSTENEKVILSQKIIWTLDSKELMHSASAIEAGVLKDLTLGDELFAPKKDLALTFKVPFGAELITLADVKGKGQKVLLIGMGRKIIAYDIKSSVLAPALEGAEIKGRAGDEFLRLDGMDMNGDGKDEIIITAMNGKELISYIYSFEDGKFRLLWKGNLFLRPIESALYAQKYNSSGGFRGHIFGVSWNGKTLEENGKDLTDDYKLPDGINIFDFALMEANGTRGVLAYDKDGFLNFYNGGVKSWRSPTDFGGFLHKYKNESPTVMVDMGEWSLKDKIYFFGKQALVIKREQLVGKAKGLGYKKSEIKGLIWNGISFESFDVINNLAGTVFDFVYDQNRLLVLSSPVFNVELKKLVQGNSPISRYISIYPLEAK